MSKLIDFYEKVLNVYSLTADDAGYISADYMGVNKPKIIKDKRLALPTKHILRSSNVGELAVFHPIPEQLNQGESEIIKDLVRLANIRLSYTLTALSLNIAWMIADTDNHKNLTDEQTEIMIAIGSINKTRFKTIERVLAAVSKELPSKSMVSVYLRRGGTLHGKRHSCVAVSRFPLYEELSKPGETLYGIKVKEEDRDLIKKILEYVLPDLGVKDRYNAATHSDFIPFLESLLNVTYLIGSKLNEVVDIMGGRFTDNDIDLKFNLSYYDVMINDMDTILEEARRIPSQLDKPTPEPEVPAYAPQPQPNPYHQQPTQASAPIYGQRAPAYQQQPTPGFLNSEGKVDLHAALAASQNGYNQNGYNQPQANPFLNSLVPPALMPVYAPQYPNQVYGQQPMVNQSQGNKPWHMSFGAGVNIAPTNPYGMYI